VSSSKGPGGRARPALILVVDDDEAMRTAITETLRSEVYDAVCARNGFEALEEMERRRPDLLLLDLIMPGMTGWDVLAVMARRPRITRVPVVVLTGLDMRHDLPPGRAVLHKPVERELLLDVMRAMLDTAASTTSIGDMIHLPPRVGSNL
jgi:CheY-like chemotaxis protein